MAWLDQVWLRRKHFLGLDNHFFPLNPIKAYRIIKKPDAVKAELESPVIPLNAKKVPVDAPMNKSSFMSCYPHSYH